MNARSDIPPAGSHLVRVLVLELVRVTEAAAIAASELAAAKIRERLVSPERRHMSFVDAGNRVYGRVLVLTLIKWLMVGACGVTNIASSRAGRRSVSSGGSSA